MYREHPIKILRYCIKNLWLLIFPLLRSTALFPFSPQTLMRWFVGAWFDILIFLVILGAAILRWRCCRFDFCRREIRMVSGIFLKKRRCIPCKNITSVTESDLCICHSFLPVLLKVDTAAASQPGASLRLWMRPEDLAAMHRTIPILRHSDAPHRLYRPNAMLTLLFSFLFSSSLSGTVYIIAFFFQAGSAARDLFWELGLLRTLDELNTAAIRTFNAIPSVVVTICVFLAVCRVLSFVANLLHYGRFRTRVEHGLLSASMGVIIRRRTRLRPAAVHYVIGRQNLIMKLFGMQSLHLSCSGFGNGRRSMPVLIPLMPKKNAPLPLSALMPGVSDKPPPKLIRGCRDAVWNFVWQPMTCIGAMLLAIVLPLRRIPIAEEILFPSACLMLVPAVWMLLIRLLSVSAEFIAYNGNQIQLHYSKGFSFYTITAPLSHIISVEIHRTPFTQRKGICNVVILLRGHKQRRHRLVGVSESQVRALLHRIAE